MPNLNADEGDHSAVPLAVCSGCGHGTPLRDASGGVGSRVLACAGCGQLVIDQREAG